MAQTKRAEVVKPSKSHRPAIEKKHRHARAILGSYGTLRGPLPDIARKVSKRMNDLGYSAPRLHVLSGLASDELNQLFPDRAYKDIHIDEFKIRHLLMAGVPNPKPTAMKGVEVEFLEIIAYALRVPPDFLLGRRTTRNPVCWDPLVDTDQSEHVKHLMKTYEEQTGEFIGWATFLPCSFETKEFMELHHDAIFSTLSPSHKALVVSKFNDIGNTRRLRLFNNKRSYTFTVLICRSDLEKIGHGKNEYQLIGRDKRKAALQHVNKLLKDYWTKGIALIVAEDNAVKELKEEMRDTDGVIVMGDQYTQWRLHRGDVMWSEHSYWIHRHRGWIEEFRKRAVFTTPSEVGGLLDELAATAI